MNLKKNILIIGGTGLVGKQIAAMLAKELPDSEIYIGSRKAKTDSGNYVKLDVNAPDSLKTIAEKSIQSVVLCAADSNDYVLDYCITHQIDYIDITKPTPELASAYRLAKSRNLQSQVVFSSGWMGGIVGSLAYHLEEKFELAKLFIYYSLSDQAGESTTHFIAENVTKPFPKYVTGNTVSTKHFLSPYKHDFAFGIGPKKTYDFDIPELFIFHEVEKIPSVEVKMTYDSGLVSGLLHGLQKFRVFDLLSHATRRKMFNASGKGNRIVFEVLVQNGVMTKKISLADYKGSSHLTAFSTVLHIKKMLQSTQNGLFFSHQLHAAKEIVAALKAQPEMQVEISFK